MRFASSTSWAAREQRVPARVAQEELERVGGRLVRERERGQRRRLVARRGRSRGARSRASRARGGRRRGRARRAAAARAPRSARTRAACRAPPRRRRGAAGPRSAAGSRRRGSRTTSSLPAGAPLRNPTHDNGRYVESRFSPASTAPLALLGAKSALFGAGRLERPRGAGVDSRCAEHGARVGRSRARGPYAEAEGQPVRGTKAPPARRIYVPSCAPSAVSFR